MPDQITKTKQEVFDGNNTIAGETNEPKFNPWLQNSLVRMVLSLTLFNSKNLEAFENKYLKIVRLNSKQPVQLSYFKQNTHISC